MIEEVLTPSGEEFDLDSDDEDDDLEAFTSDDEEDDEYDF